MDVCSSFSYKYLKLEKLIKYCLGRWIYSGIYFLLYRKIIQYYREMNYKCFYIVELKEIFC